ncbi:MAG TPA: hypothetical protein VFV99_23890 [Kofleriaceae bacterium]|nr:hypothetical protein [Kofleriaceae bacterium]
MRKYQRLTAFSRVIAAMVCGCSSTPDVDSTPCVQLESAPHDDFEQPTASPCSWGQLSQLDCTATVENGDLVMAPKPGAGDVFCVCGATQLIPFTSTFGTIAEVHDVATEVGEDSVLVALASVEAWRVGYDAAMDMLFFEHIMGDERTRFGYAPWDPAAVWWRVRLDEDAVIGEVSADGERWVRIGADHTRPPPEMILPSFMTLTSQPVAAPSTVRIGSFNVCPP